MDIKKLPDTMQNAIKLTQETFPGAELIAVYKDNKKMTDFKFSEMITEIENELACEYIGGAINWADENYKNAWSDAMLKFDEALSYSLKTGVDHHAQKAGQLYKKTVLDLLKKYKKAKKLDETKEFLKSVQKNFQF